MNSQRRWDIFVEGLEANSRAVYNRRTKDYIYWCVDDGLNTRDPTDAVSVLDYLNHLHESGSFCAKTLWTISSIISSWYETHHNHKVHEDLPLIRTKLKQWEKEDAVKKAKTFDKDEILHYLRDAPNDDIHHPQKVALIIAISGLERKSEVTMTSYENLILHLF
jgi:site-specific recombinase XerD